MLMNSIGCAAAGEFESMCERIQSWRHDHDDSDILIRAIGNDRVIGLSTPCPFSRVR